MCRDAAPLPRHSSNDSSACDPSREAAAPAPAPALPGGGLSALLEQARVAQARLGDQSLPIANRDVLLITKLLGG